MWRATSAGPYRKEGEEEEEEEECGFCKFMKGGSCKTAFLVGPGRYRLPRHRMLFNSRNESSRFVSMTRRAVSDCPWFKAWEDCVDKAKDAKDDFVTLCENQTSALRDCMLKDPGYYGDMLGDDPETPEKEGEGAAGEAVKEGEGAEKEGKEATEPVKAKEEPAKAPETKAAAK